MLAPTTRAVENRGSSTVKVALSRITSTASKWPVTSQQSQAGTQETGSLARSRASTGWASASSSASVTAAPSGKRSARDVTARRR